MSYADIDNMHCAREAYTAAVDRLAAELEKKRKAQGIPTGWYVLLRRVGRDWVAIACVNPLGMEPEDIPEEWDVVLSIPEPDSMPEFMGF